MREEYISVKDRKRAAEIFAAELRAEGLTPEPAMPHGKAIASSFWGRAWCSAVDVWKDYESRLPAGRSLLKNGGVIDLKLKENLAESYVAADRLYRVRLHFKPADPFLLEELQTKCAGKLTSLVDFIRGDLSDEVMALICDPAYGIFPAYGDFRVDCDCLDDAVLCRHAAAVLYAVAPRQDDAPELFFTLRGIDPASFFAVEETLEKLSGDDDLEDLSETFGIHIEL